MSDLNISVSDEPGEIPITVFRLAGRVNLGNSDRLMLTLRAAFNRGSRNMILDLTGVESLTSAGLRVILQLYKLLGEEAAAGTGEAEIAAKSPYLKLAGPNANVREVFQMVGIERLFEIYQNVAAARASFTK
jgi:anti-anti-sigma regulatory factor